MFIPSFHFVDPAQKLTEEWCMEAVNDVYYQTNNRNLLEGKKIAEILGFASGEYDMTPFYRMFKSIEKKMKTAPRNPDGSVLASHMSNFSTQGIEFNCVPLIPIKLNSAVATVQKIPVEVEVVAQDGLAMKKKKEDLTFLRNKPMIEADLQPIADRLQIDKVDLGSTKHSFEKYSDTPYGLDLNEPDEENIFSSLVYSLTVEKAFEKAIAQVKTLKKSSQVRHLEVIDQFHYGISVHRNYQSSMTGLPQVEYVEPDRVRCPKSSLKDFADTTHRIIDYACTPMELFNLFSDEIRDEQHLEEIINAERTGYCACNQRGRVDEKQWGTFKIALKYIEIRSVDYVSVVDKPKSKRGYSYLRAQPSEKEAVTGKLWGQNTYGFYWLVGTKKCFGIHRLGYSYRTRGQESFQNFSSNIYKSQAKSAVELCVAENKKATIADIKLQHALIKAMPSGKYVDLKFIRGALSGLNKDEKSKHTLDDLLAMVWESNNIVGDSEEFDGPNDGQLKPVIPIPGGLDLREITGYIQTMAIAAQNISSYTGINDQLTGQAANPEGLVGLQKLLINSGINAIYYISEAMRTQDESEFTQWACLLQYAIEEGGATKQTIIDWIGVDDTRVLEGLNDVPLHNLTMKVKIGQREEERARFLERLNVFVNNAVITSADEYLLSGIENPKERFAALAVLEKRFARKEEEKQQAQAALAQQLASQQGQNQLNIQKAKDQGSVQAIYTKGEVEAKLMALADGLGMNRQEKDGLIRRILQADRGRDQLQKSLLSIRAQADAQAQTPAL